MQYQILLRIERTRSNSSPANTPNCKRIHHDETEADIRHQTTRPSLSALTPTPRHQTTGLHPPTKSIFYKLTPLAESVTPVQDPVVLLHCLAKANPIKEAVMSMAHAEKPEGSLQKTRSQFPLKRRIGLLKIIARRFSTGVFIPSRTKDLKLLMKQKQRFLIQKAALFLMGDVVGLHTCLKGALWTHESSERTWVRGLFFWVDRIRPSRVSTPAQDENGSNAGLTGTSSMASP